MANAVARACSVLQFQWIMMLVAISFGGTGGDKQDRPAALEQAGFDRAVVQADGVGVGPAQHGDVEHAAVAADEALALRRVVEPAKARRRRRSIAERRAAA